MYEDLFFTDYQTVNAMLWLMNEVRLKRFVAPRVKISFRLPDIFRWIPRMSMTSSTRSVVLRGRWAVAAPGCHRIWPQKLGDFGEGETLHWEIHGNPWKSPNGMEDVPVRWEDHLEDVTDLRWTWLPEGRLKNTTSWHVMARSWKQKSTFWICLVLIRLRFHDWLGVAMTPFWSFRQAGGILLRTAPRHRLPDSMGLFENFRNVAESMQWVQLHASHELNNICVDEFLQFF